MHPPSTPPQPRPHREVVTAWILLLLDGGASYGYELRRALAGQRLAVELPVVYRTLRALEDARLVQSRWMRAVAGPRRRLYRLTPAGRRRLDVVAGQIANTRDLHDAFLLAHERALRTRRPDAGTTGERPRSPQGAGAAPRTARPPAG